MTPPAIQRAAATGTCALALALLTVAYAAPPTAPTGAYWPQFRGLDRSNVAKDTGLLPEWPKDGPPLLWKITDLGAGYAPVSVVEGRIYTLAYRKDQEYAVALDRGTGKEIWAVALGPARQFSAMQFLFQRQPVVDGERLFVFTASAELWCLDADTGQTLWSKSYPKEFQGRSATFGWNDNPLVDGDRLICTPGAKDATLMALNKRTGEIIWKAVVPEGDGPAHSPAVVTEAGGVRQYVQLLSRGVVGVAAQDGKFLWRYNRASNGTANVAAPVVHGDHVFVTSGFGVGGALLKLRAAEGGVQADEVYFTRELQNVNGGVVRVGDHLFGSSGGYGGAPLVCLEMTTGKLAWRQRGDFTSVLVAEGHLICRHNGGALTLIEATPQEYKEKGRFMQPERSRLAPWTYPVLAGGRLYLRDQDVLLCYDLRANRPSPPRKAQPEPGDPQARLPDAIFVPSPQDVVEKMLELAAVKKGDRVVDLGCGDGRIVVTAAKKFGCQAIGYDIDPECVRLARENVKKSQVDNLVRIEHEDIFKADLSNVDVVCLYLLPALNARLVPQLEKMKVGSRIVSHAFEMPGFQPDQVISFTSKDDKVERKLFVWTVPLKKEQAKAK